MYIFWIGTQLTQSFERQKNTRGIERPVRRQAVGRSALPTPRMRERRTSRPVHTTSGSPTSSMPPGKVERDAAPFSELWQHGKGLTTRMASRTCFMGDPSANSRFRQACERPSTELDSGMRSCR